MGKKIKQTKTGKKRKRKTPGLGTTEFQSYFKFWSYTSGIHSWYWHISRRSDVVLAGDWLVSIVLFFCLPVMLKL
jgi:hypothetical protein